MSKLERSWKSRPLIVKVNIVFAPLTLLVLLGYSLWAVVLIINNPAEGGFFTLGNRQDGLKSALWLLPLTLLYAASFFKFQRRTDLIGRGARLVALLVSITVHLFIILLFVEGSEV